MGRWSMHSRSGCYVEGWCPSRQSVTFQFRNFSVSKLLGFKTSRFWNFSIFLIVSDSVQIKFGIEKSMGFGIKKIWYRKKYRFRYGKMFRFGFVQIWGILGDVSVSKLLDFNTFPLFRWYRIRYQKNIRFNIKFCFKKVSELVSEKVSVSVLFRFWVSSHIASGRCKHGLSIILSTRNLKRYAFHSWHAL